MDLSFVLFQQESFGAWIVRQFRAWFTRKLKQKGHAPIGISTWDLLTTRRVLYLCATTVNWLINRVCPSLCVNSQSEQVRSIFLLTELTCYFAIQDEDLGFRGTRVIGAECWIFVVSWQFKYLFTIRATASSFWFALGGQILIMATSKIRLTWLAWVV